ncbi:MAG TPA: hypothetical protein PL110_01680 [Candidatus Eremiobacteraeota bacterium]|nr:MAG: hypothetical protein BWY64_00056 [bacterium ADurb.Bin363]HPZ06799.1 hypothetical protein [Candidatus Eremiobacteraeota bacterium]
MSQDNIEILSDESQNISLETTSPRISKKNIKRFVNSPTDKYLVISIKDNLQCNFKFLDNTALEGKIKWFNKYNLGIVTLDGTEYIILKHALKYILFS